MIEIEVNKANILKLINNLRDEDMEEFKIYLKNKTFSDFLNTCFDKNNEIYFLGEDLYTPVAIGGAYFLEEFRIAQVWLLCGKNFEKHRVELFKYVLKKIEYFKSKYKVLFNYIFKTNFSILKMLIKKGFKVKKIKNNDFKLFYFENKGGRFDIRYFAGE